MSQALLLETPHEFFAAQVDDALKRVGLKPLPLSRAYLVELLEHYVVSSNLFDPRRDTLAEIYLRAHNSAPPVRQDLLKKLGDRSLYISGFFGDSLSRKVVDIDYYVDMGGAAYGTLAADAADEHLAQVYGEYAARFTEFVDVLTYISQGTMVQTDGDLLKLYGRYLATGSKLAEDQLVKKGLLGADLQKSKITKI